MKLSELRPCDRCGGAVGLVFHVVRTSLAIVRPDAAHRVVGLAAIFGGIHRPGALPIAEAMGPDADVVTLIAERPGESWEELRLCSSCWADPKMHVASLLESLNDAKKSKRAAGDGHK